MKQNRSDFLSDEVSTAQFNAWADILPAQCRILRANLFADVFLADAAGAVHMLEVSAGTITEIASSEEEFRLRCVKDEDGWLLRPLVDRCRSAGMMLNASQCYAFTTLPLFGGGYKVDNIWMCSWREWFSFTASIYSQTKNFPDGSTVKISIVD